VNDKTAHRVVEAQDRIAQSALTEYALRVYPVEDATEIRLADLWNAIWRGKWLILITACILTAVAVVAALLITPRYRAQVVMAPVTEERANGGLTSLAGQLGGLAAMAGITVGEQGGTAESIATLQSRAFTDRFIQGHNLLPVLFADLWDGDQQKWDVSDPEDTPTLADAYERFNKSVRSVSQDAQTGLVTLTIDWSDPQLAADWANALVSEVNATLRSKAIEQSKRNFEYLTRELQEATDLELRTAIFSVMQSEMRTAMLANVRTEYAFRVIDPAAVPEKHYWPNLILFVAVGFTTGLMLGLFATFLRGTRRAW
jgi:uncharacterized protein involved in exopolysaccharide biosynthesis